MAPPEVGNMRRAGNAARRLTSLLADCKNTDEVLALARRHLACFDSIHTTTCLHVLAKLSARAPTEGDGGRGVNIDAADDVTSNAMWGSSKASNQAKRSVRKDNLETQQRDDRVILSPRSRVSTPSLTKPVVDALLRLQERNLQKRALDVRQLTNTVWAVATLPVGPSRQMVVGTRGEGVFLRSAMAEIGRCADTLNHQDVANCLWAMATLQAYNDHVVTRIATSRAAMRPEGFKPQELANSLWALAICDHGTSTQQAFQQSVIEALNVHRCAEFQAPHLSMVAWAMATADASVEISSWSAFASEICCKLHHFKAQEVSNTCWAFATASVTPTDWPVVVGSLAASVSSRLPSFKHQELVNVAWAFAEMLPPGRGGCGASRERGK
eukprot:TRINITY_DN69784_c0_g1_i1.p1 TRINITY_DN69784_c0_g1~~TRINITY_DN69784_c0_g1_i1.p1  ORF type:complete len:403 (+),score=57.10 TRINITY_DN69784_c0_g1_i1:58-1209(+)